MPTKPNANTEVSRLDQAAEGAMDAAGGTATLASDSPAKPGVLPSDDTATGVAKLSSEVLSESWAASWGLIGAAA